MTNEEQRLLESLGGSEPSPLELAEQLTQLADSYFSRDEFESAEPLYWRALETLHGSLGPVHIRVANTLQDLAELYEIQEKYSKAEHLYECIMAILADLPEESCPGALESLRRIEGYYESRGLEWQMANVRLLSEKFAACGSKNGAELTA